MSNERIIGGLAERVRNLETREPRPTMWEVWHSAGLIDGSAVSPIETPHRIYNLTGRDLTLVKVFISLGVAPTSQAVIVDIEMDAGGTIFAAAGDRPSIAVAAFTDDAAVTKTTTWPDGSYLVAYIDQQDTAGDAENLTVQVVYHV